VRFVLAAAALVIAIGGSALTSGRAQDPSALPLDEHPLIQYAGRPTTDRVEQLNERLTSGGAALMRDPRTGYLSAVLRALDIPAESQLLVFSKTGVQRAYTSAFNPRALYFDESVAVGYIPGAPVLEVAAHDPQQGVVFYVLSQTAPVPVFERRTVCRSCHVSATTLYVPGMIARSNLVGDDGLPMPQLGGNDVDHRTPHPDRWGGWFVTSEGVAAPYAQRAHEGNITFTRNGSTSNQVFIDWMNSAPDERGYLSPSSDIVALLLFDHQMHAINLLTRLNWEARIAAASGKSSSAVEQLIDEAAEYLLFAGEQRPSVPLTPRDRFAERFASKFPRDRQGRSLAQLDLVNRLLRYPCSYLVYSPAFDGLQPATRQAIYRRMIAILSDDTPRAAFDRLTTADRRAIVEILRDTKRDFPRG
jgi:hypothetical protein